MPHTPELGGSPANLNTESIDTPQKVDLTIEPELKRRKSEGGRAIGNQRAGDSARAVGSTGCTGAESELFSAGPPRDRWFNGLHSSVLPLSEHVEGLGVGVDADSSDSRRSDSLVKREARLTELDLYGTLKEKHTTLTTTTLVAMYVDVHCCHHPSE